MTSERARGPSVGPIAVVVAGALASISLARGLFDPDYFWHVAIGRYILQTGTIPTTDPFSFSWFGRPWIPDQWLADVAIAWLNSSLGEAATIVAFAAAAAAGPALVAEACRRQGAPLALVALVLLLAEAAILPQVTPRPQVLGVTLIGAVLAILISARPDSSRWLLALPPIFVLWANTHGSFVIGLGIVGTYLAATLLGRTPMASHRTVVAAVAAAAIATTMLTPSGPAGVAYALTFADPDDLVVRGILEWQSPNFHGWQFLPFLAMVGAVILGDIRRAPGWMVVVALIGAGLGLYALRSVGFGVVMIMPAVLVANLRPKAVMVAVAPQRARRAIEWAAATAVALIVVAAVAARGPVQSDPRRVPVEGTEVLRQLLPDARVLARYEWGGYVIDELYASGARVFADGRMPKHANDALEDYVRIIDAGPGWEDLVDAYRVEAFLVSVDTPVAMGPAQDDGWCEAYRDQLQVLLLRDCPDA